jgi:hypothetical protein
MQPATMTRITGLQRIDFGQQWPSKLSGAPDVTLCVKYIPVQVAKISGNIEFFFLSFG